VRILIVKLSSLGDVVHAMPAVQDIRAALSDATIDWVVENAFVPLVARCVGVQAVIPCEIRRWRKSPLGAQTRSEWRAFRDELRSRAYDAVIDLQGLTKSALIARTARMTPTGRRFALANQTEGSSYEAPTRWVADVAVHIEPRVHAVARSRELCARALGYRFSADLHYGLKAQAQTQGVPPDSVAFVHGTSREDKLWPEANWVELGRHLTAQGYSIGLPHGNDVELARSERLAHALGHGASVWPRLDLAALTDRLAGTSGVVGVDSGLSHIAVALNLPHVQIYNFDTAWRTGPVGCPRQLAVYAQPQPSAQQVLQAWNQVRSAS
jgi:heptosyltransferase-1